MRAQRVMEQATPRQQAEDRRERTLLREARQQQAAHAQAQLAALQAQLAAQPPTPPVGAHPPPPPAPPIAAHQQQPLPSNGECAKVVCGALDMDMGVWRHTTHTLYTHTRRRVNSRQDTRETDAVRRAQREYSFT